MRSRPLFFCLLCFVVIGIEAQTFSHKTIRGQVIAKTKDVAGVTIQNSTSRKATITDLTGSFTIKAKKGDTLVFSAVQFKRKILPVTENLLTSPFVQVPLEEFINELAEVTVQPFGLSGAIEKDLEGLQLEKDVSAEALGLPNARQKIPTQSERMLQQATYGKFNLGMILSPPLDPLINMITGRTKMLKNRVKLETTYGNTLAVQKKYTDSIFGADLKIPSSRIDDFMYFCEVDAEFQQLIALRDELKLWEYLLAKSKDYRENNGLE